MDIIITVGFERIKHNINFSKEGLRKGKEIVEAKHVIEVKELRATDQDVKIQCEVKKTTQPNSSLRWKPYLEVSVKLNEFKNNILNCHFA